MHYSCQNNNRADDAENMMMIRDVPDIRLDPESGQESSIRLDPDRYKAISGKFLVITMMLATTIIIIIIVIIIFVLIIMNVTI